MYTKISDYVTCYNPYCIAIHIAYDNGPITIRCFGLVLVHVFYKHDLFCKIRTF